MYKKILSLLLTAVILLAPYNGENEYSINADKAEALGYSCAPLKKWIFELLDFYICEASFNRT